jgi:hypothetical protein
MKTLCMTLAVAALVIGSAPVMALTVPGGGPAKSDCYNGFEVTTANSVQTSDAKSVTALACNNTCTFKVMACVGLSDSTGACTATALKNLQSAHLPKPATFGPANACGAEQDVTVTLKKNGKKANKAKFRLKGTAVSAKPKVDNDVLVLKCVPNPQATGCGATTTTLASTTTTTVPGQGQAPVALGSAATFVVLAGSTVTNTDATTVTGDLGVSPGTAVTGFPPGTVTGATHAGDPAAAQAQIDLTTAFNDAAGRTVGAVTVAGNLGGQTLTPGLYKSTSSLEISSGDLTLDAQGNATAVFIFQMASTLTTTAGRQVILSGGAKAANVFWQVGSSATLGTTSVFKGNLLADQSITLDNGATLDGRALAQIGAVTLDANTITKPAP